MASSPTYEDEFLVLESPIAMKANNLGGSSQQQSRGNSPSSPPSSASPSSSSTPSPSLFYDEGNAVVISVTQDSNHQFLDVVAVSMATGWRRCLRFARPELMRAIKFSPDLAVVSALWEKSTTFEFVNLPVENQKGESHQDNSKLMPYSYTCVPHATSRQPTGRGDPFEVYGCEWLTPERLVTVTSTDVELLNVQPSKRQVKQIRSQHVAGGITWYKWAILPGAALSAFASSTAILALFTKKDPGAAQPLLIRTANIQPLSRFEIDSIPNIDPSAGTQSMPTTAPQTAAARNAPRQQDVAMLRVYNCVYLVVLLLQPRAFDGRSYAELQLYQFLPNQNCFIKTRIVRLYPFDSLAIAFSVVDDLLIAHHQTSQTCLVFDLNVPCEYDQFVSYHSSLVPPQPATWLTLKSSSATENVRVPVLPDLILRIDGLEAWRLTLRTDAFLKRITKAATHSVDEAGLCLIVAMGRSDQTARWQVVDALKRVLFDHERKGGQINGDYNQPSNVFSQSYLLSSQRSRFDFLARIMPALATGGGQLQDSTLAILPDISPPFSFRISAIPSQSQLANGAFDPALRGDRPKAAIRLTVAALMEFIRAVVSLDRPVEYSLAELLVHYYSSNAGAQQTPGLFQLYQLLQYRVVTDSVPLACSLLSLSRHWPAGYQLSLDMLRRLPQGRGISHAAEVLLTSGAPPTEAVRLLNATQQHAQPAHWTGGSSSQLMVPTTPSHATLLAAVSSNSPGKPSASLPATRSSPTMAPNSSSPSLAVTGPMHSSSSSASLQSMDPRKPLDFAVASESQAQLLAILTYHGSQSQSGSQHQSQQQHQAGGGTWLTPYWEKMTTLNSSS